jgi:hypothetical protein
VNNILKKLIIKKIDPSQEHQNLGSIHKMVCKEIFDPHNAALIKIILAILNDTSDELPKNLKTKAKRIKKINGKEV